MDAVAIEDKQNVDQAEKSPKQEVSTKKPLSEKVKGLLSIFKKNDIAKDPDTALKIIADVSPHQTTNEASPINTPTVPQEVDIYGSPITETSTEAIPPSQEQDPQLEGQIKSLEKGLGIETASDRALEASLFIDKEFLDVAVITGNSHPERLFGDKEWEGYLEARKLVKEHGNQPLTPEFIIEVQKALMEKTKPEVAGKVRDTQAVGGEYGKPGEPITLTDSELRAIAENKDLSFDALGGIDVFGQPQDKTGVIKYPGSDVPEETETIIMDKLQDLSAWYNEMRNNVMSYDPHYISSMLQHKLVSIHPFLDGNGTTSRMIMNWSLENWGENPSIIPDPNRDILSDEFEWIGEVKKGSERFKSSKEKASQLKEVDVVDVPGVFGLGQEEAFYQYVYKRMGHEMPGAKMTEEDRGKYSQFKDTFNQELEKFNKTMSADTKDENLFNKAILNSDLIVHQGGLISSELIKLIGISNPKANESTADHYTNTDVYRGGFVSQTITDENLCKMFDSFVGLDSSYISLGSSGEAATSRNEVKGENIENAMTRYNQLITSHYFETKDKREGMSFEDRLKIKVGTDLEHAATVHWRNVAPAIYKDSPFVSWSLRESISSFFGQEQIQKEVKGTTFLMKAKLPKEGVIYGPSAADIPLLKTNAPHSYEDEVSVAGGISPSQISEISIYKPRVSKNTPEPPLSIAKRINIDGKEYIQIQKNNSGGNTKETRTYSFNQSTGKYESVEIPQGETIEVEQKAA